MAQAKKISELTSAGTITGLELAVVVQDGETRQTTAEQIVASVSQRLDVFEASVSADIFTLYGQTETLNARLDIVEPAITSINAEVSLKAYRSGDYLTNTRYIEFDTSVSTNPAVPGKLAWNSNDGTLDIGLLGDSVLQVGQETLFYIKNTSGVSIANGQMVMATSAIGASGKIGGAAAIGDGSIPAEYFLGVATQTISPNDFGYVTHFGLVRGFNTTGSEYSETWADSDLLYVNASVTGGLTNAPPAYPGFSTPIAIVVNAGSGGSGSIFVRMKSGEYLEQLHDVDISNKAAGDIITWNTSISAWVNSQVLVETQASLSALIVEVSALTSQVNALDVSAVNVRLDAVSAVAASAAADVSALTIVVNNLDLSAVNSRLDAVSAIAASAAADVSALTILVNSLDLSAVNSRLDAVSAIAASAAADVSTLTILVNNIDVSAINARIDTVSALTSVNAAAITSINVFVSAITSQLNALDVSAVNARLDTVSAAVSVNSAAITSINAVVSALDTRVEAVSVLTSVNGAAITSINVFTSTLQVRIAAVSASVSALQIQITSVSARTSVIADTVSILQTQVNAVSAQVSTLAIRVDTVSAQASANAAAIVSINSQVTFAAKTFTSATFNDGYTEEVFVVSGTTPALAPNNGSIQVWTLTGNSTPTQGTWNSGQSMTLMIDDGTAYTVTWTSASVTWKTDGGSAPTLNTTGFTAVVLWKVSATLYGARVGNA